jgi:hypothetical protein
MIEISLSCPHCGASTVYGECTGCFWHEEPLEVIDVRVDERKFDFPFIME